MLLTYKQTICEEFFLDIECMLKLELLNLKLELIIDSYQY